MGADFHAIGHAVKFRHLAAERLGAFIHIEGENFSLRQAQRETGGIVALGAANIHNGLIVGMDDLLHDGVQFPFVGAEQFRVKRASGRLQ